MSARAMLGTHEGDPRQADRTVGRWRFLQIRFRNPQGDAGWPGRSDAVPAGAGSRAFGLDLPGIAKLGEDESNGREADVGECSLDVAAAELGGRLPQHMVSNPVLLTA